MARIMCSASADRAFVRLTDEDDAEYILMRFEQTSWVRHADIKQDTQGTLLTVRVASEVQNGPNALRSRVGLALRKFRQESAETPRTTPDDEAVRTASDEDNEWKDIIRYRPKETNELIIGHVGATPAVASEPEPIATTTDRPVSPLAEIIGEVGNSARPVKVTVVGLYVSADGGYDMTEVSVESLPT